MNNLEYTFVRKDPEKLGDYLTKHYGEYISVARIHERLEIVWHGSHKGILVHRDGTMRNLDGTSREPDEELALQLQKDGLLCQEIFDKVATHLLKQNARSLSEDWHCMYRGLEGQSCAVGCLIADEHYSPRLEGVGIFEPSVFNAVVKSLGLNRMTPGEATNLQNLLSMLQNTHDMTPIERWRSRLTEIADAGKLEIGVLK